MNTFLLGEWKDLLSLLLSFSEELEELELPLVLLFLENALFWETFKPYCLAMLIILAKSELLAKFVKFIDALLSRRSVNSYGFNCTDFLWTISRFYVRGLSLTYLRAFLIHSVCSISKMLILKEGLIFKQWIIKLFNSAEISDLKEEPSICLRRRTLSSA